ncbi:MAG: leucine-rich repeat protein, partial [Oscillospiraceae bacterium]|nr:leucine-rich repeat protein [Oscillospiraceae bacterium]
AGWRFDGWYTAAEGGQHARDIDLPGSDLILYAHWTRLDAIVYIVSFDPCGGTVTTTQIQAPADKPFGTLPTPVRNGWVFEGWYTEKNGGQHVRAIDYPGSNLILYAHWRQNAESGTVTPEPEPETPPATGKSASCGDGLDWSLSAGTLTVFGNGAMYDFSSPEETPWAADRRTIRVVVIGQGVTHIGDYAFCSCTGLSSVQLPAQIESIGVYAFAGCPFQSLDLSGSIGSIGARAFENCGIISLTLSGSIGNIGSNAFARCASLTLLEISGEVNRIGTGAFEDCNSLWSVNITGRVKSIDDTAFPGGTTIYRG